MNYFYAQHVQAWFRKNDAKYEYWKSFKTEECGHLEASGAHRLCPLEDTGQIFQESHLLCVLNKIELQLGTPIPMGSWLSQPISSSKTLEYLGKFVF